MENRPLAITLLTGIGEQRTFAVLAVSQHRPYIAGEIFKVSPAITISKGADEP